ncbi:MAG TPA: GTP-binding protein, partial [Thermoanaerobaculia bacterium]|nr:GTP-binding protein [Thermoanaerobaculia bacterium]
MQVDSPAKIRNLAVAGHNDTGKTTLISSMLFAGGVTNRLHRVEDGNTLTDFDPEEVERAISIGLAPCFVPWKGHKINLLDCPGYGIFFTETRAGMRAADAVLLAINGVSGVEVNTEKVWQVAEETGQPVLVTLTKMDRERADFGRALESLRKQFGRSVQPVQIPIGQELGFEGVVDLVQQKAYLFKRDGDGKAQPGPIPDSVASEAESWRSQLIEAVAETDEALLEKFLEGGEISQEELVSGLRKAVASRSLFPLTLSAAAHGIGPAALLDHLVEAAPSPVDAPPFPATNLGGEALSLSPDPGASLAALVFKTFSDPYSGKISIFRVVTGSLRPDSSVWCSRTEEMVKLGHVMFMQGKQGSPAPSLIAGDIGGFTKVKEVATGDTLTAKEKPLRLGWFHTPE